MRLGLFQNKQHKAGDTKNPRKFKMIHNRSKVRLPIVKCGRLPFFVYPLRNPLFLIRLRLVGSFWLAQVYATITVDCFKGSGIFLFDLNVL